MYLIYVQPVPLKVDEKRKNFIYAPEENVFGAKPISIKGAILKNGENNGGAYCGGIIIFEDFLMKCISNEFEAFEEIRRFIKVNRLDLSYTDIGNYQGIKVISIYNNSCSISSDILVSPMWVFFKIQGELPELSKYPKDNALSSYFTSIGKE